MTRRLLLLLWRFSFVENPMKPNEKKCDQGMATLVKSKKYGAALHKMALTNLHRLELKVANGKREHIIVLPVSMVKDTETYGVENDPFKLFWECCIRPEPDSVLKLHEIWANF